MRIGEFIEVPIIDILTHVNKSLSNDLNNALASDLFTSDSTHKPSQLIYYGVPGCGKSNKINETLKGVPEFNKIRVVFHPEYTNADFVGQILPVVNGGVSYEFTPGPFSRILRRAYLNPNEHFYLVIEEINRGNAAAIFGDTFQLLDRLKLGETDGSLGNGTTYNSGWSQYFVCNGDINAYVRNVKNFNSEIDNSNEDQTKINKNKPHHDSSIKSVMNANDVYGNKELFAQLNLRFGDTTINFSQDTGIRLPPNLSIVATMNTSDQNVFALDNAFQRRFDMVLVRNEFETDPNPQQYGGFKTLEIQKQHNAKIADKDVTWGEFWKWINDKITNTLKGLSSTEDKRLGVWFVSNTDGTIEGKVFAEKVLKYLYDDVFKFKRNEIFAGDCDTLEKLIGKFELKKEGANEKIGDFSVFKSISKDGKEIKDYKSPGNSSAGTISKNDDDNPN